MMDLEPFMLTQAPYNAGQLDAYSKLVDDEGEPLVIDDGLTKTINTLLSADTDWHLLLILILTLLVK